MNSIRSFRGSALARLLFSFFTVTSLVSLWSSTSAAVSTSEVPAFVAVSGQGHIAISSDGINYTVESLAGSWADAAYGDGMWVVVGNRQIATSTDGLNWSVSAAPGLLQGVRFGDGRFVAVGNVGQIPLVANSVDGVNWGFSNLPSSWGDGFNSVAYANGYFVAEGWGSDIVYSQDGLNWTDTSVGSYFEEAAYGNGRWVNVGWDGRIAVTTDLSGWYTQSVIPPCGYAVWRRVVFGNNEFVATSEHGCVGISSDGYNWTFHQLENTEVLAVSAAGGVLTAIAQGGTEYVSYDNGATWSTFTLPADTWNDISHATNMVPTPVAFQWAGTAGIADSLSWSWADSDPTVTSFTWSGACSGTGDVTEVTCGNLVGGQTYTLNVTATNANGTSEPVSSTAVAENVPGAPQLGSGSVVGAHQARWSWSDDAANGAPITSYTWSGACSGSGDVTTVTCSNLPGGSTESLSVVATNAMGDSPASSASIAMPITAPDGVAVSVVSGPMGFRASWSAPANGGSPLTGYNVQVLSASGQVVTQQTLPASATSFGATKLTNGANYSFAITATNAALLASTPVVTSNIVPLAEVKLTESAATYSYGAAKSLLTVKVAPTATGTVTFSSGSTVLCTANVSKGSASCSVSATSLNAGTYSITANFSGNATTAPSETSSSLVVSKAKSTLSLVLNKTKLPRSQVASIIATAVLSSPIGSTPPGSVTFTLDGKAIANNSSSLSFSSLAGLNLSAGTHVIEVTYGGSTNYLGSTAKATFTLS